jgi:diguanylate cyclase (GGDEF)-like protein
MDKKILILTDKEDDFDQLEEILGSKGFEIFEVSSVEEIAGTLFRESFPAMIVDCDFVGQDVYHLTESVREKSPQCCMILYGEMEPDETVPELLQSGAYGFVPRSLLTERIYDTVLAGLENRRAFIEIMGMMDELKDVNVMLEREKEAFRRKNIELDFVNRLSSKVAYDLRWDNIVPRILSAGLSQVIDLTLFGIFYWIDSGWHLALHAAGNKVNTGMLEKLKTDLTDKFMTLSGEGIVKKDVSLHLYPSDVDLSDSCPVSLHNHRIVPLMLAGQPLGMVVILPKERKAFNRGEKDLLSTMANVLAMSLKNAQEYNKLKEMAVTDGLTEILNHKGFRDVIKHEFHRAKRYNKLLSLVMIDIDNFKQVNDAFGHQAGDLVLLEVARCLKQFTRNSDIVARYGGDEFAILLPETGMEKAKMLAKRVSDRIRNHVVVWKSERLSVEISHGISTIRESESEKDEEGFILRADSRLYDSKRSRNRPHLALLEA